MERLTLFAREGVEIYSPTDFGCLKDINLKLLTFIKIFSDNTFLTILASLSIPHRNIQVIT